MQIFICPLRPLTRLVSKKRIKGQVKGGSNGPNMDNVTSPIPQHPLAGDVSCDPLKRWGLIAAEPGDLL